MINWSIHPAAQAEIEEALAYYFEIDPLLAADFKGHFTRHLALVRENPFLRQIRRFAVRHSHLAPQFHEHYIAYMIREGEIVILALGHSKRRPRSWQERLRHRRPVDEGRPGVRTRAPLQ